MLRPVFPSSQLHFLVGVFTRGTRAFKEKVEASGAGTVFYDPGDGGAEKVSAAVTVGDGEGGVRRSAETLLGGLLSGRLRSAFSYSSGSSHLTPTT